MKITPGVYFTTAPKATSGDSCFFSEYNQLAEKLHAGQKAALYVLSVYDSIAFLINTTWNSAGKHSVNSSTADFGAPNLPGEGTRAWTFFNYNYNKIILCTLLNE